MTWCRKCAELYQKCAAWCKNVQDGTNNGRHGADNVQDGAKKEKSKLLMRLFDKTI